MAAKRWKSFEEFLTLPYFNTFKKFQLQEWINFNGMKSRFKKTQEAEWKSIKLILEMLAAQKLSLLNGFVTKLGVLFRVAACYLKAPHRKIKKLWNMRKDLIWSRSLPPSDTLQTCDERFKGSLKHFLFSTHGVSIWECDQTKNNLSYKYVSTSITDYNNWFIN